MSRIVAVAIFCSLVCSAIAQTAVRPGEGDKSPIWRPQSLWKFDDNALAKATVPKEMIASLRVSGVTIPLEEDSELASLQTMFGGKIGSQGDAA
jgi:hypothetical protein